MQLTPMEGTTMRRRLATNLTTATSCAFGVAVAVMALDVSFPQHFARAQDTKPANPPGAVALDLGARYRIQQHFTAANEKPERGAVTQYRVQFKHTIKVSSEQARQSPASNSASFAAKYQERPVEVSATDQRKVTGAIRHYEKVKIFPDRSPPRAPDQQKVRGNNPPEDAVALPQDANPSRPQPFEDLTIWYRPRVGELSAEILVMTPGHRLSDDEFRFAAKQPFLPDFLFALPEVPVRVGEGWVLGRAGATALLGRPADRGLKGKFVEIRDDPTGKRRKAIFDITGKVNANNGQSTGPTSVHAQIDFVFDPPAAPPQPAGDTPGELTPAVDLVGEIVRIALAEETVFPSDKGDRLNEFRRQELIMEVQSSDPGPLLEVPKTPPQSTVENSWLTYEDPKGRYHFLHPQEFLLNSPEPDVITLLRPRTTAEPDVIEISLKAKADLQPEAIKKAYFDEWKKNGVETVRGEEGWLPEADWPNMKVYLFDAALIPPDAGASGSQRKHAFRYIVQTGRATGLDVEAITPRHPSTLFRQLVESVIKTFKWGPAGAVKK
jgi:hypothetical protein